MHFFLIAFALSEYYILQPPYAGMGKEMVLHYSNTPGFNRARNILLMIFWGSWMVLLGAVIYLTVTHERSALLTILYFAESWYFSAVW